MTTQAISRGQLLMHESMSRYNSWRVGGQADRLYIPADIADMAAFLSFLPENEPLHVIGLGSNLLVRDGGVRGTVIVMHGGLHTLQQQGNQVYAEAGVTCARLAKFSAKASLHGIAFMAGIPGTVGGALAMNAGCHGSETWQLVHQVETIDRTGRLKRRSAKEYQVSYRHVTHPAEGEWFVAAWFDLKPGATDEEELAIRQLLAKRLASQPLNWPNAGSTFRNPPGDHAARLIEACGLKGYRIGDAQVSEKHANFIVNLGAATAREIEQVMIIMQTNVAERFGVHLQAEVKILGEPA